MAAPRNSLNTSSEFSSEPQGRLRPVDSDSLWHENKRLQGDLERSLTERNRLLKRIQEITSNPKRTGGSRVLEQRLSETRADVDALHKDKGLLNSKVDFLQEQLDYSLRQQRILVARLREAVALAADGTEDSARLQDELPDDPEALAECSNRIMESLWHLLADNDALQSAALREQMAGMKAALSRKQDENLELLDARQRLEEQGEELERELAQLRGNAGLRDQRLVALQERVLELEEEGSRLTRSNLKFKSQVKALRGTVDPEMFSYVTAQSLDTPRGESVDTGFSHLRGTLLGVLGGMLLMGGAWQLVSGLKGHEPPFPDNPALSRAAPRPSSLERAAPAMVDQDAVSRETLPAAAKPPRSRRDRLADGMPGAELVLVPGGEFRMGTDRYGRTDSEGPSRPMRVGPFWMSRFEVSFDDYDRFARASARAMPSDNGWGRGRRPVVNVSWNDAHDYARWLSRQTGERYRLPTEAEWEFAIAGGADSIYWWGNELQQGQEVCLSCGTPWDGQASAPVGSLQPNPLGLYDMGGNVMEWVADCMEQTDYTGRCGPRVVRGGSFDKPAGAMRSTARRGLGAGNGFPSVGFRLVREL
jgi:formylglycine-generating enzyme required for sulfatase activity